MKITAKQMALLEAIRNGADSTPLLITSLGRARAAVEVMTLKLKQRGLIDGKSGEFKVNEKAVANAEKTESGNGATPRNVANPLAKIERLATDLFGEIDALRERVLSPQEAKEFRDFKKLKEHFKGARK